MNNGVTTNNNTQQPAPANIENTLTPMAGVKIAPAEGMPVDASSKDGALNANNKQSPVVAAQQPAQAVVQPTPVAPPQPPVQPVVKPTETPQPVQSTEPVVPPANNAPQFTGPPVRKKSGLTPILLILILGLGFYLVYSTRTYNARIENLTYECTPVTSAKEDTELDLDSTLVRDLYSRVVTNIREDLAQPEFNDNMKIYLAYRQIPEEYKYDSNCNLFSVTAMEPYKCEVSTKFKPKAIKEETVQLYLKKLYGEKTEIALANIRLGRNSCIGGYQYIAKRGEFVQGYCSSDVATSFKVDKELKKATSNRNTIILTEEVKYHEAEKQALPESLKSGTYYYTFRLDMNYNYVLVSKTYQSKY